MHGLPIRNLPHSCPAAATAIKDDIMTVCNKEANHPDIQIFRRHPERMFQLVKSPDICQTLSKILVSALLAAASPSFSAMIAASTLVNGSSTPFKIPRKLRIK